MTADPHTAQSQRQWMPALMLGGYALVWVISSIGANLVSATAGQTGESGYHGGGLPWAQIIVPLVMLTPFVLARRISRHAAGFGTGLASGPRFAIAAATAFMIMSVASTVNIVSRYWMGQDQWTGISATYDVTLTEMLILGANAGITEEITSLLIPVGLVYLTLSLIGQWRPDSTAAVLAVEHRWWIAVTIGAGIGLISRFAGHVYQGYTSAIVAVAWGIGLALVYYWVKSIWPLILGHAVFNIPMIYADWTAAILVQIGVPAAVIAGSVLWARRRRAAPGLARESGPNPDVCRSTNAPVDDDL